MSSTSSRFAVGSVAVAHLLFCFLTCAGAEAVEELLVPEWKVATEQSYVRRPAEYGGVLFAGTKHDAIAMIDLATGVTVRELVPPEPGSYATPVVRQDTVFVSGSDSNVSAIDASTGEIVWFATTDPRTPPPEGSLCERMEYELTKPAVDAHRVYVGSRDGNVYALTRATGEVLWEHGMEKDIFIPPLLLDGVLVALSYVGEVHAISPADGSLLWSDRIDGHLSGQEPAVADGVLYLATSGGSVLAYDPARREIRWSSQFSAKFRSPVSIRDGLLCVGDKDGVFCLNSSDGSLAWHVPLEALGATLGDGLVYAILREGSLIAMDSRTGRVLETEAVTPGHPWCPPVLLGSRLVIATGGKDIPSFLYSFKCQKP